MAREFVGESVPLSRLGVLVAQLESVVASAARQSPDALLCFDLLSDLLSSVDEEPVEAIILWQRKCEDALHSLLILGACRPVRHFASRAMAKIISRGDRISVYSRASSVQGFLSDAKKNDPQCMAGAAQCLGELYKFFGRSITSGLLETTIIVARLLKFHEEFVRQEAMYLLQNALEGSGGTAASATYIEAFRVTMHAATGDKSFIIRIASAKCLQSFANIGGPGLASGDIDNAISCCLKGLDDALSSVREAFSEALGSFLALVMHPNSEGHSSPSLKKLKGYLQKYLVSPPTRAGGVQSTHIRFGMTLSWVCFLQTARVKYLCSDSDLQTYGLQVIDTVRVDASTSAHLLACVIYILRVGVIDQMTEPSQRSFLTVVANLLQPHDASPTIVVILRIMAYILGALGEVPVELKEVLDDTVVASLSHSSSSVRVEASLTLRVLAEVDPTCVGGLVSYGVTNLNALREGLTFKNIPRLEAELDCLHGQATMLAALIAVAHNLPLGYPSRFSKSVLKAAKEMIEGRNESSVSATVQKESAWLLLASLIISMPKEELEGQVFDILSLWAPLFSTTTSSDFPLTDNGIVRVFSAALGALAAFIDRCHPLDAWRRGILLQPVLVYLSSALFYIASVSERVKPFTDEALDVLTIRILIAYRSLPDPTSYRSDSSQLLHICSSPFRESCEEGSCLGQMLDKRDAWLGPWIPGRNRLEDDLRYFSGENSGTLSLLPPQVWEASVSLPETVWKVLANQMLLCFGQTFASLEEPEMLSFLRIIDDRLKSDRKKQSRHTVAMTNACVVLLSTLKSLLARRVFTLPSEVLGSMMSVFLSILAEATTTTTTTTTCSSQRRACAEGLGLLSRFGNDVFTAKMTRSLLGELDGNAASDSSSFTGSVAFALGCVHRSAGGLALSSLVPRTLSLISSMAAARSTSIGTTISWYVHGLVLTIEAAGSSCPSHHVHETLGLALEILIRDETGSAVVQRGVGLLVNAVVTVLGPDFSPGSIFFSRCRTIVFEMTSNESTPLLENVRFTQQLVLFAPQAVSVRAHLQTLLPSLDSGHPVLRHLAITTVHHLIERDPSAFVHLRLERRLFLLLDEETDPDTVDLLQTVIKRLMYASAPSRPSIWIVTCRDISLGGRTAHDAAAAADDGSVLRKENPHARFRTRLFAAECLSQLPFAVGESVEHFDLRVARSSPSSGDYLVVHLEELISAAYMISTVQFAAAMQPSGLTLLCTIVDKFSRFRDPDADADGSGDHLLLEQYRAQFISSVRIALNSSSSPPLLVEAGLQLATKILTGGIIRGDTPSMNRISSLISRRPLGDDPYYPSFAEWVSSMIEARILAAHASLKCHTRLFSRDDSDEYKTLAPLFSRSSEVLSSRWISTLKDYCRSTLNLRKKGGLYVGRVPHRLKRCLDETWGVILRAVASGSVEIGPESFRFLWSFAVLVLSDRKRTVGTADVLSLLRFLTTERFPVTEDAATDLLRVLHVLSLSDGDRVRADAVVAVFSHVAENSPDGFYRSERFSDAAMEVLSIHLLGFLEHGGGAAPALLASGISLLSRSNPRAPALFPVLLAAFRLVEAAADVLFFVQVREFLNRAFSAYAHPRFSDSWESGVEICLHCVLRLMRRSEEHGGDLSSPSDSWKLAVLKLGCSLEHCFMLGKLGLIGRCVDCFRTALTNAHSRVRIVALQVLKNVLQRSTEESAGFSLFFVGEVLDDPFAFITNSSADHDGDDDDEAVVGQVVECWRILLLLFGLSKTDDSRRIHMRLFLSAVFVGVSLHRNRDTKTEENIKRMAGELVSEVAGLPSSGVHLKDAFMAVPDSQRLHLHDIISSSLPASKAVAAAAASFAVAPDDDDKEDWDAFQSFPVSSDDDQEQAVVSDGGKNLIHDSGSVGLVNERP